MIWPLRTTTIILLVATFWAHEASAAELRISNLTDVDFGFVSGANNRIQQHIRICVSSSPAGPYQLTALGAETGGSFELSNGGTASLAYSVSASPRGRGGAQPMTPGLPMNGFMAKEPRGNGSCQPPFAFVIVEVDPRDVEAAPGGIYSATLQLMVAPE